MASFGICLILHKWYARYLSDRYIMKAEQMAKKAKETTP